MTPEQLNEYRVFHLAGSALLPLIEGMHTDAYEKLMQEYRMGKETLLASVARIESLYSLKQEIINKMNVYEKHAAKENK